MKNAPLVVLTVVSFIITGIIGPVPVYAQDYRLPIPGVMVHLSPPLDPPMLKGIKVHPDNPFRFDFILDKGDSELNNDQLKNESSKLIKYFLASLTIPEKDLWVNLSPYEKDRIIPNSFGLTEMGRDLLGEDYMLKQITASLIYPEDEVGKKFWKRIYEEAAKRYGTTNIPVNTFNKVWIVPDKAVVFENAKAGTAYVVESKLKVMLEQDYLSLARHEGIQSKQAQTKDTNQLGSQIVREIVLPELTTEINENKNFARLRQVYNSLILATWYKKKIKDSILSQVYSDKNKVAGVNINDPQEKEKIYQRYLRAFKKGVYNYIKEEIDPATQETIPRKYFSGGMAFDHAMSVKLQVVNEQTATPAILSSIADSIRKAALILVLATLNVWGSNTAAGQNSNEATPKGQTFRDTLNIGVEFDFNQDQNGQYSLHIQSLKPKLTKEQREKAIKKAILYQLQDKNLEPAYKRALEKFSPDAVERSRWIQNTSAQELLNRFELMNNTQEGDLTGDFEKRMDSSEAKDFVFSLAVDSKDEQEFNQVIGNYLKFNMVRAVIQPKEVRNELYRNRLNHEARKAGKPFNDNRHLVIMIADTSDWNGALKESANFKIITDQNTPVDLTDSLIKQGYRVLTAEAGTFDDVVSAVRDFTQFEPANLVILGAHGNSKSIGDKWFYLSDAERKREGSVSINSNHENQWQTALEGRIKGKVLLDSCGTGGSCVGANVADVVARITQAEVIAPTDIIHRIELNKDGNNVSVKFYGSEWYEPDPMIRNFGKPEDQPKEKEVPAYIANPSKSTPKTPDHAMITYSEYENFLKPILERHNQEQGLNWTDILRRLDGKYVEQAKGLGFQGSRHVIPDAELSQEEKNIREAKKKFIEGDIFRAKQLLDYVITADKDGVYGRRASDLEGRIDGMGNTPMAAIDRQILVLEPTASDVLRAIKTLSLTEGMYGTEEENLRKAIAKIWSAQNIPGAQRTQEFKILANILMSAYAAYPDISDLTEPIENLFLRVEDRTDTPKEIQDIASGMDRLIVGIQHYDRPRSEDDTLAEELLTRALFVDESEIINPLIAVLEKTEQVSPEESSRNFKKILVDHREDPKLLTAIRGLLLILERPEDIKINSNNNQVRDCVALILEYLGEDIKDNDQILGVIVAYIQRWQESTVLDQVKWVETMERYAAGYLGINISKQSNLLKSILSKGNTVSGHDHAMINNGPSGEFEQEAEENKDRHLSSNEIREALAFLSAKQGDEIFQHAFDKLPPGSPIFNAVQSLLDTFQDMLRGVRLESGIETFMQEHNLSRGTEGEEAILRFLLDKFITGLGKDIGRHLSQEEAARITGLITGGMDINSIDVLGEFSVGSPIFNAVQELADLLEAKHTRDLNLEINVGDIARQYHLEPWEGAVIQLVQDKLDQAMNTEGNATTDKEILTAEKDLYYHNIGMNSENPLDALYGILNSRHIGGVDGGYVSQGSILYTTDPGRYLYLAIRGNHIKDQLISKNQPNWFTGKDELDNKIDIGEAVDNGDITIISTLPKDNPVVVGMVKNLKDKGYSIEVNYKVLPAWVVRKGQEARIKHNTPVSPATVELLPYKKVHSAQEGVDSDSAMFAGLFPNIRNKLGTSLRNLLLASMLMGSVQTTADAQFYKYEEDANQMKVLIKKDDTLKSLVKTLTQNTKHPLSDKQIQIITERIQGDNPGLSFEPGQTIDVLGADELAKTFDTLNNSQEIATARINPQGRKPIDVYFIRTKSRIEGEETMAFAYPTAGTAFVNIDMFIEQVKDWQKTAKNPEMVMSNLLAKKEGVYIFENFVRDMIYHEFVHVVTTPLIRSVEFKNRLKQLSNYAPAEGFHGQQYRVAEEVSAYLAQVSFSQEPKILLMGLLTKISAGESKENGFIYADTGHVIISRMADRLGFRDYIFNLAKKQYGRDLTQKEKDTFDRKYKNGDFLKGEFRGYLSGFLLEKSDKELNEAAAGIFKELYGIDPPDIGHFSIPKEVIKIYQETSDKGMMTNFSNRIKKFMSIGLLSALTLYQAKAMDPTFLEYFTKNSITTGVNTNIQAQQAEILINNELNQTIKRYMVKNGGKLASTKVDVNIIKQKFLDIGIGKQKTLEILQQLINDGYLGTSSYEMLYFLKDNNAIKEGLKKYFPDEADKIWGIFQQAVITNDLDKVFSKLLSQNSSPTYQQISDYVKNHDSGLYKKLNDQTISVQEKSELAALQWQIPFWVMEMLMFESNFETGQQSSQFWSLYHLFLGNPNDNEHKKTYVCATISDGVVFLMSDFGLPDHVATVVEVKKKSNGSIVGADGHASVLIRTLAGDYSIDQLNLEPQKSIVVFDDKGTPQVINWDGLTGNQMTGATRGDLMLIENGYVDLFKIHDQINNLSNWEGKDMNKVIAEYENLKKELNAWAVKYHSAIMKDSDLDSEYKKTRQVIEDSIPRAWRRLGYNDMRDFIKRYQDLETKYKNKEEGADVSLRKLSTEIKSKINEFNKTPIPQVDYYDNGKQYTGKTIMDGLLDLSSTIEDLLNNKNPNHAMMTPGLQQKGGIDLTPANMNLQTQNGGERIKFHLDPAMLQQLQNALGFVPVVIGIKPMTDWQGFLGLDEKVINNS